MRLCTSLAVCTSVMVDLLFALLIRCNLPPLKSLYAGRLNAATRTLWCVYHISMIITIEQFARRMCEIFNSLAN